LRRPILRGLSKAIRRIQGGREEEEEHRQEQGLAENTRVDLFHCVVP
jgi:hypothetical protein